MIRTVYQRKPFVVLSVCFVVLSCLGCGAHSEPEPPVEPEPQLESGPRLKLTQTEFDLGIVHSGESASCTIPVLNVGDAPLTLSKVRASCSCTVAKLENPVIPPGGQTQLSATFKAGSRSSKVKKSISFSTNDPQAPVGKVSLLANVVGRVIPEPVGLIVRGVHVGEGHAAGLVIRRGYDKTEWTSVRLETKSPILIIKEVARTDQDIADSRWPYMVMIDKNAQAGRISGRIEVFINDEPKAATVVPVIGEIQGHIKVEPPSASFVIRPNEPAPEKTILLTHEANQPFEVSGVECNLPNVEWEIDTETMKGRYELKLRIAGDITESRGHRGNLVLSTNEPFQNEIVIPVYARKLAAPAKTTTGTSTGQRPAAARGRNLQLPSIRQKANTAKSGPAKPAESN